MEQRFEKWSSVMTDEREEFLDEEWEHLESEYAGMLQWKRAKEKSGAARKKAKRDKKLKAEEEAAAIKKAAKGNSINAEGVEKMKLLLLPGKSRG